MPAHPRGRAVPAFTLVELLTVISVIALLIAILLPSLQKAREQARSVACLANLSELGHGTAVYQNDHGDRLPVSPAEKLRHGTGDGHMVSVRTTCHWGGRRAEYLHGGTEEDPLAPESEIRPLTRYLYPNATLDSPTPIFRCPSDRPTDWSNSLIPGANIYRTCGNSYYINFFGKETFASLPAQGPTSKSVLYMETPLYEYLGLQVQGDGWHRRFSTHNLLFLDLHAASTYVDSRQREGRDWSVTDFLAVYTGFYP
ncbi:MAG TPA: DUF1559 domain-containing protein [Phycisphaerae bacterium]|nr:DUF1559 domain-containing protein [Phycisphaerae bacterium]